jgi:hypothetical protein
LFFKGNVTVTSLASKLEELYPLLPSLRWLISKPTTAKALLKWAQRPRKDSFDNLFFTLPEYRDFVYDENISLPYIFHMISLYRWNNLINTI